MTDNLIYSLTSFLLGSCFGSFLNVCDYRIPLGLSLIAPPSSCPSCQKPIPFYLNIPILGWFLAMGKCGNCKKSISPHYFIIESLVGILFLAIFLYTKNLVGTCLVGALISMLTISIRMDLKYFGMPTHLLYASTAVVVLATALAPKMMAPRMISYHYPLVLMSMLGAATLWGVLYGIKKVSQLFYCEHGPVGDKTFIISEEGITVRDEAGEELSKWSELPDSYIRFTGVSVTLPDGDEKLYAKVKLTETGLEVPGETLSFAKPLTLTAKNIFRVRDTLGEGDLILAPALGALVGFNLGLLELVILGCFTGTIHGYILKRQDRRLPFGPHLIIAAFYVFAGLQGYVPRIMNLFR